MPIQRLVVRARNIFEQLGIGNATIADAAKALKNYPGFGDKAKWKEDVGIGQVSGKNARLLDAAEPLVVVAHGAEPTLSFFGNVKGDFAQRSPSDLAKDLSAAMPDGYTGEIFLNGCYTGLRYQHTLVGSSYIERFGKALNERLTELKRQAYTGNVKGNLGMASTENAAIELITVDQVTYEYWKKLGEELVATSKDGKKFYLVSDVLSPIGQALYSPASGEYTDGGFLKKLKAAKAKKPEQDEKADF